jgi:hypothetical protein
MFAAPSEFDKQDEGHTAHGPLTWNVITNYYKHKGTYSHKRYNNTHVLTGPFAGMQSNNKELVINHFSNNNDWKTLNRVIHQKNWQK